MGNNKERYKNITLIGILIIIMAGFVISIWDDDGTWGYPEEGIKISLQNIFFNKTDTVYINNSNEDINIKADRVNIEGELCVNGVCFSNDQINRENDTIYYDVSKLPESTSYFHVEYLANMNSSDNETFYWRQESA